MRHAETAVPTVFHGAESDSGLSERGRRQAIALAGVVAGWGIDAVISSGMRRAIDTATPIAEALNLPLRIEPLLHERRVGVLGGQPNRPEHPLWTETLRHWTAGDTAFTTEGAESFDEICQRVVPVFNRLNIEFAGRSIFIVAHGLLSKVLMLSVLPEWPVARWAEFGPMPNLAITELIHNGTSWHAASRNHVPEIVAATA